MDIQYVKANARPIEIVFDGLGLIIDRVTNNCFVTEDYDIAKVEHLDPKLVKIEAVDKDNNLQDVREWMNTPVEVTDRRSGARKFTPRTKMVLAVDGQVLTHSGDDSGYPAWFVKTPAGVWACHERFVGAIGRIEEAESVEDLFEGLDSELAQRDAAQAPSREAYRRDQDSKLVMAQAQLASATGVGREAPRGLRISRT